jgi:enediyne biosynthesis protein E4
VVSTQKASRAGTIIRLGLMTVLLVIGTAWLRPRTAEHASIDVRFVELAEQAGCRNIHSMVRLADDFENIMPWLSSVGAAAAVGDFDNDGFPDLYVNNSGRGDRNVLFRNLGDGTFEDVTDMAGVGCGNLTGASMHAIWGDIDNNGRLDLYVVKWAEPNQLFRNNGDGTFTDISVEAGVDYWGYGNAATFLDYDRDGRLDLLVGNYFPALVRDSITGEWVRNDLWNPVTTRVMHETFTHAANGGLNMLYRNRGDGTFQDVTQEVGLHFTGWTLAVGAGDLNNDSWPDLYLANDFGPDEYYLNTGATEFPPRFRLIVDPQGHPGIGNDWWKGMNVDMGDVTNNGYLDIYVTNILEKRYKTDEGNMLWLNLPDPTFPGGRAFRNVALQSGTFDGGWGWGGKFADFNNDGLLDIYTVNGFVTGHPDRNYWYQIQEMVTQTKNQTVDARDWPVMGDRDLSGRERGRLFIQVPRSDPVALNGSSAHVPRFTEVAEHAGILDRYNGRGIAIADFNHSGYLDIFIANQGAPSCYYVNMSGEGQLPVSRATGPNDQATPQRGAQKSSLLDKGEQRSSLLNTHGVEQKSSLLNTRGVEQRFSLQSASVEVESHGSRQSANRDLRVARSPQDQKTTAHTQVNSFLRLKLRGRPDAPVMVGARRFATTADAVGSRVTVETANGFQMREVQGGMGFASQSEHTVHFGIPDRAAVQRVTINWPSGRRQVFEGDSARALIGRITEIVEPVEEVARR